LGAARREAQAETGRSKPARAVIAGLTGLIPLLGGLLYLTLGSPGQPSAPFAARVLPLPPSAEDGEMVRLVQELETQLASRLNDIEGHILLARSYKNMGAYDQALPAYQKAVRLEGGNDPTLAGEYAEVMVITNGGQVPPDAVRLFTLINQNIPGDPQATYYLALAKAQAGDLSGAINDLEDLKAASLPNAPWRPGIDALLEELREDQATRRETNQ
ncbi:MAG: tetratricopeptide repeat protein, partial [Pseudomonadota bacterium]